MRPAVIIVDMLEDSCAEGVELAITPHARALTPRTATTGRASASTVMAKSARHYDCLTSALSLRTVSSLS